MKLRRPRKALQPTQARHLERQPNEILDLILSELRLQRPADLLRICLVSRQLYILALPHLYRKTCIDLRYASHLRLLRRLERPGSRILSLIRHLHLVCLDDKHAEHRFRIRDLFQGLVILEELEWEGPFDMPVSILNALLEFFPQARLSIKSRRFMFKGMKFLSLLGAETLCSLRGTAISTITYLDLNLDQCDPFDFDFQQELIGVVISNPALKFLQVAAPFITLENERSMTETMEGLSLPRLRELRLFVHGSALFTEDELNIWGLQGGWEELEFLGLYHIESFIPFIGRTPKLGTLWLLPRDEEDTADLESRLMECKGSCPFPVLHSVKTRSPWSETIPARKNHRVIPWYLLDSLPLEQLQFLDLSRPYEDEQVVTDMPQAEDIAKIRDMCPDLKELRLDMILTWDRGPWPSNIVRELTAWVKPINLMLFLHVGSHPAIENMWSLLRWLVHSVQYGYRSTFKIRRCFRKERQSQMMPNEPLLMVDGISILPNDSLTESVEVMIPPDQLYGTREDGGVSPETMSLQELAKKTKRRLGNILVNKKLYKREIRRRKELDEATSRECETDVTLYDTLMQSEPMAVNPDSEQSVPTTT
jgi:hypothetical protein